LEKKKTLSHFTTCTGIKSFSGFKEVIIQFPYTDTGNSITIRCLALLFQALRWLYWEKNAEINRGFESTYSSMMAMHGKIDQPSQKGYKWVLSYENSCMEPKN